jgi:hypothetical protein
VVEALGIGLQRRAGADQVAVAIDVVDPPTGGQYLSTRNAPGREAALLAG